MDERTVIPFVLVALAVYRVGYLITSEDGPFYLFSSIRKRLMQWEQRRGRPHWIIDGFHCILCVSFWLGFLGAFFVPFTSLADYAIIALALSSITVLIKKRFG